MDGGVRGACLLTIRDTNRLIGLISILDNVHNIFNVRSR